jgi:hypothetical protein
MLPRVGFVAGLIGSAKDLQSKDDPLPKNVFLCDIRQLLKD